MQTGSLLKAKLAVSSLAIAVITANNLLIMPTHGGIARVDLSGLVKYQDSISENGQPSKY